MFLNRRRRGRERFLHVRVGLFFVAAVFLVTGMVVNERWPALAAIGVAAVALLMRFLTTEPEEDARGGDDGGPDDDDRTEIMPPPARG